MAWVFKQGAQSATAAVAAGSNLTAGSLVVVFHADGSNTSGSQSCSKTAGTATVGAFTRFAAADDTTDVECIAGFWAVCSVGGSATLTVAGGTTSIDTQLGEWTGQAASPADIMGTGDVGQAGSSSADADKSQSITTAGDGDLIVAYISDLIATATFTKGGSPNVWSEAITVAGAELEYFVQAAHAAIQATWTASNADKFQSAIGSFKVLAAVTSVNTFEHIGMGIGRGIFIGR